MSYLSLNEWFQGSSFKFSVFSNSLSTAPTVEGIVWSVNKMKKGIIMAVHESKHSHVSWKCDKYHVWDYMYNECANETVHYKTKDDEDQPPELTF